MRHWNKPNNKCVYLICTMYYAIVFYRDLVHGWHESTTSFKTHRTICKRFYDFYLIFSYQMCVCVRVRIVLLFFIRITTNYPNNKCFLIDANIKLDCFYGVMCIREILTYIGIDCFVNNCNTNVMNHVENWCEIFIVTILGIN